MAGIQVKRDGVQLRAGDVMRRHVVALSPDMTLREAAQVFFDHGVSGAPVVDAEGRLVGAVSQRDLVLGRTGAADEAAYFTQESTAVAPPPSLGPEADERRVRDVMAPASPLVREQTSVRAIGRVMLRRQVHRVVVGREGTLAGIVTSMDVLRALLR
ncbi:MAG TPA: CBS domain-containing protein [bacterium]